jgi:threonine synthase
MWPWGSPPLSIAYGILDDETYDWVAAAEGMFETAGLPVVVSESTLSAAHRLAHIHTSIPVDPTGSAGLAGLIELRAAGVIQPEEAVAVLFTGVER